MFAPSQAPPHVVPGALQGALVAEGCCPLGTVVHVPFDPGKLQDWHWPSQGALQHTPSAHTFDAHSLAEVHSTGVPDATHTPLAHDAPLTQSLALLQLERQTPL